LILSYLYFSFFIPYSSFFLFPFIPFGNVGTIGNDSIYFLGMFSSFPSFLSSFPFSSCFFIVGLLSFLFETLLFIFHHYISYFSFFFLSYCVSCYAISFPFGNIGNVGNVGNDLSHTLLIAFFLSSFSLIFLFYRVKPPTFYLAPFHSQSISSSLFFR